MPAPSRLAKHLEGWQVGALVVLIVSVVTLLLVPRSAIPERVPPPAVTAEEIQRARAANDARAREAVEGELPNTVQIVGALVRALGRAEWEGDRHEVRAREAALGRAAAAAYLEADALDRLRAYQARLFADAYFEAWKTGRVSDDLIELGGQMLRDFAEFGWLNDPATAPPHADLVLSALYKRRFIGTVTKDHPHPLLPLDPVEERLLLGYQIEHPPIPRAGTLGEVPAPGVFVLRRIDELAALEPSYPVLYAKGIVLFRMAEFDQAAQAFDAHIRTAEDAPYRLRAINYLKASLEHATDAGP